MTSANNLLLQYDNNNYCRHPCPEDILVFVLSMVVEQLYGEEAFLIATMVVRQFCIIQYLAMESEGLVMMVTLSPMTLMSQTTSIALNSILRLVQKCTMELSNASTIH